MSRGTLSPLTGTGPQQPDLRRSKGTLLLFGAILSVGLGVLIVRVSPLLVWGIFLALAAVTAILIQPFLGLLLYLVIFIVRPQELYPVLQVLRLERVVGALTIGSVFFQSYRTRGGLFLDSSHQTRWLLAFVVAAGLSVPASLWPTHSVEQFVELLKILVFYLMIVQLVDSRKRFDIVTVLYLFLILFISMSSLKEYYSGNVKFRMGIERAVGLTSESNDPNHLGTTLASAFPLYLLFLLRDRRLWLRGAALLGGAAAIWTMLLTGSRSSLVAWIGGLLYLCLQSKRRILWLLLAVGLSGAIFAILPDQYKVRYESIAASERDASSQSRITLTVAALQMFLERPVTGVGIGCFSVAYASMHGDWLQPHSLYGQVISEVGILGMVTFFAFLIQLLRVNRGCRNAIGRESEKDWSHEEVILQGLFAGTLVLLVAGLFGHSLLRRTWYFNAGLALAAWRIWQDRPRSNAKEGV